MVSAFLINESVFSELLNLCPELFAVAPYLPSEVCKLC